MKYQKKILLDNAWTAWGNAIRFCGFICSGRSTLENRKNFVASLHNAAELFLKQIMLDQQDHQVASIKDPQLSKKYQNAPDLNEFFATLSERELSQFHSIQYSQLVGLHTELLQVVLGKDINFSSELNLLKDLRNNETHFYINQISYLNENEFQRLHNFMVDFFEVLTRLKLLPFNKRFFGRKYGSPIYTDNPDIKYLWFAKNRLNNFSYKKAIKESSIARDIEHCANGIILPWYTPYCTATYSIAEEVFDLLSPKRNVTFDVILDYVKIMTSMDMIEVIEGPKTWEPVISYTEIDGVPIPVEGPECEEYDTYKLKVNLNN